MMWRLFSSLISKLCSSSTEHPSKFSPKNFLLEFSMASSLFAKHKASAFTCCISCCTVLLLLIFSLVYIL
uniref:Mads1 n=1 Tax=Arundo donax TaxID=35708 RepID=A0A0A9DP38_ARUDO